MFMIVIKYRRVTVVEWGADTVELFRKILNAYDKIDFTGAALIREDGYVMIEIKK